MKVDKLQFTVRKWVHCECRLCIIPEIGHETQAIVQLHLQGLIINCRPFPTYSLRCVAFLFARTERCLSFVLVFYAYFDNLLLCKRKLEISTNDLDPIRPAVRAHASNLKQVYKFLVFAYMESPITIDILAETMNWLICPGPKF